jgi:hypothetical protein
MLKKKIWADFQRIIELFTQKIVSMLSLIWVWDPGSRGQKGTGSRIRIRKTVLNIKSEKPLKHLKPCRVTYLGLDFLIFVKIQPKSRIPTDLEIRTDYIPDRDPARILFFSNCEDEYENLFRLPYLYIFKQLPVLIDII